MVGEVGNAVFEVAKLALQLGQYDEAKTALDESEKIARAEFGSRHINYASVLQMQAKLEREQGRPREALPLLQRAIDILQDNSDCPDLVLAGALNNFGFAHQAVGLYGKAEQLFKDAMELVKQSSTQEGQQCYTSTLANLAELYNEIGQDERARPLLVSALDIDRRLYTPGHPALATSLHNLGVYLARHGGAREGIKLLNEASRIVEASLGRGSPEYARDLSVVAHMLREARRYKDAEVQCIFALDTFRKSRPENSPDIAGMLSELALVYACRGKFGEAEGALRKAIRIFDETLPRNHKDTIEARFSLFVVLTAQGQYDTAFEVLKEAFAAESNIMDAILRMGSEKDRLAYLTGLQWHVEAALSFVVQNGLTNRTLVEWVFEAILRRKGLAAEVLSTQRDSVWDGATPELKEKLERLNALKLQIARLMLNSSRDASQRGRLEPLEAERANLERELADKIPEIGLKLKLQALDWKKVAGELSSSHALIEFVRYASWHFGAVVSRNEPLKGPERYAAFVLRAGAEPSLQLIDLGEAGPIDRAVAEFRACLAGEKTRGADGAVTRFSIAGALAALIPSARRRREKQLDRFGQAVARAVIAPLRPLLDGRTTLVVIPDGHLLWLPFECLPEEDACWLDRAEIVYLGTSRELVARPVLGVSTGGSPVVIADPDYDLHDGMKSDPSSERRSRALREVDWRFAPLEGTRVEGEAVAKTLGVQPFMGAAAKASTVKKLRSPRILHIATHGFFFDIKKLTPANSGLWTIDQLAGLENPMLRSGLALAGANAFLDRKPLPADAEDGIVTAEDVTGLDLHRTDLVVLSACETGLGEIHSGEGVFGFRRAFGLAGARMLIVSLWKVADAETQELMHIFYEHLMRGKPVQLALHCAKLEVRKRHRDPFYWAAFICIGRDPVRGKDA
jgi:CHAT domain-containing protein/tetratricopeptide (TPR) repeat protein